MKFYYVYVLFNKTRNFIYIGYTANLRQRFQEHNSGKSKSTKHYIPYHSQAALALGELKNLSTVGAAGHRRLHQGKFDNVIFVVDDLVSPLREVIVAGLNAVPDGFKTVTLPTMRLGVMQGVVEKTTEEAINEMVEGIKTFLTEHPDTNLEAIIFVVYNDPEVEAQLKAALT